MQKVLTDSPVRCVWRGIQFLILSSCCRVRQVIGTRSVIRNFGLVSKELTDELHSEMSFNTKMQDERARTGI